MGRQLPEIEGSVDFLTRYVPFNLGKLLNENLAVMVKLLTGGHTLSLLGSAGELAITKANRRFIVGDLLDDFT